jgi:hypothetical protein
MLKLDPKHVMRCENCGMLLPTVEIAPGKFAAVQPVAVISLAPGKFKIQPPDGTRMVPQEILAKMLEHSIYASETLPAFIPHDFACTSTPEGTKAPLMIDLTDMQRDPVEEERKDQAELLDFMGKAAEKVQR